MDETKGELVLFEREGSEGGATYKLEVAGLGVFVGDLRDELQLSEVRVRVIAASAPDKPVTSNIKFVEKQTISVGIPAKLLALVSGQKFRFRTPDELNELIPDEKAALKDRARRQLANPLEVDVQSGNGLFGVKSIGTAELKARFFLNPALIDGVQADDWVLRAEASAEIELSYRNVGGQALELTGRFLATVLIRPGDFKDWLIWDFGLDFPNLPKLPSFDIPQLPGFDLKLPKIPFNLGWLQNLDLKLPSVDLDFLDVDVPSLFSVALPPFVDKLAFKWTSPPKLAVKLDQGKLTVSTTTPGAGTFSVDNTPWVTVTDVTLAFADKKFDLTANLAVALPTLVIPDQKYSPLPLPFTVETVGCKLKPSFGNIDLGGGNALANASLAIEFTSDKIIVASKDDPTLLIAFSLDLTISYDVTKRQTHTDITRLNIVEPYPINLITSVAKGVGQLIRLIAAIPVPAFDAPKPEMDGFLALLDRAGKMLAAAGKWLAKQAGKAAEALAGLVEAVFEALMQLGRGLAKLGKDVVSHIAIEVRLDPKTYHVRQIVLMPVGADASLTNTISLSALGFDFELDTKLRPSLVVDLGPESWVGLVIQPTTGSVATLGTDLWLDKETTPQQAMGATKADGSATKTERLIQLKAEPTTEAQADTAPDIVVAVIQNGRPRFFQTFGNGDVFDKQIGFGTDKFAAGLRETGTLVNANVRFMKDGKVVSETGTNPVITISLDVKKLETRLLSLLTSAESDADGGAGGFIDKLKQKVEITSTDYSVGEGFSIKVELGVKVHIGDDFAPETTLAIAASLRDLSMKITGGEKIYINSNENDPAKTYHPLGLDLTVSSKDPKKKIYKQFYIDLTHGGESLGLADEAKALLAYGKVSTSGKGLQFEVPTFRVGRAGFDLEAKILPEPVKLGGVDVPFRFTSGQVAIKGSKFGGGSLTGSGQLPQALVGEANATIALQLGAGADGGVVVKGATARLDKSGDPIRCMSTRFELTITELGFDFVNEGSYHFYFLLTGSAVFKPGGSEYATGLLKHFKDVTIKLDKAPLAADPRVLLKAISFQVKVDPPKKMSFFDIFDFELRGFGFHPAAPKFDGAPAMSVSGQVKFTKSADKISPNFEFHSLWIAGPKPGSSKPRIRFDGLTVGVKTGAVNVEATAIAVDGSLPDLYDPGVLPKDVTAEGFLASGKLDIQGWASMSGAMGFLELRKEGNSPKHSFFIYGQAEKLAQPIDTPVGRIYLREFGFGFGYKYTLAGIAQAETATSPQQLVKILDDVSKYQGSLNTFKAWQPTYYNDDVTLALRGMFALSAAGQPGEEYKPKAEAGLPNPLLFDIVAAFRTDFTFLINLRAWLSVNYHDWTSSGLNESWKAAPTMRGYLYFSVPRKEFLGRFIADGKGHIGEHPKLPEPLVKAIQAVQFSATLYIRPGLFHAELGWPYELGFTLGEPGGTFYLDLKGGLIHRVEDFSVLNGIAFKAKGSVYLEGKVGGSSLGAAAVARANFAIEARVLSYLSLKDIGDSFYYGYMRIDVAVGISVEVWLSFKIFGKRIRLSASFSLYLAVSIALEGVIGPSLLGARADVSIGVRAFGRSLSVRIALSFNDDKLAIARAKVARFMEMGLAAEIPDKAQDGQRIEKNPKPEPPRGEIAGHGDTVIDNQIAKEPLPPEDDESPLAGRPIGATDFWAILYPTRTPKEDTTGGLPEDHEWFVMQLLPRDHTEIRVNSEARQNEAQAKHDAARATFFASPKDPTVAGFTKPGHRLIFKNSATSKEAAYLGHIDWDGKVSAITIAAGHKDKEQEINLAGLVAQEDGPDGRPLRLGKLLQTLFAGTPDDGGEEYGGDLMEPNIRQVVSSLVAIDADSKASASQLERAGRTRTNLEGDARREAEIEDARSSVISTVAETAGTLATSGGDADGKWPERLPQIDARDFGLTFLVNQTALNALFDLKDHLLIEPPVAQFDILKSDVTSESARGAVALFNPPARMFRVAQPKFTPTHTIDAQGIKLNWDLEPAWGASQGAYDDPEFHLKHYRIRRIIRGLAGNEYRADFLVKAGSAIQYAIDAKTGNTTVRFLRPDFQFVDSLRRQEDATGASSTEEIPETLRKLLLGEATDLEWAAFKGSDIAKINLLYEIVPVDNAGTSDFGQVHIVDGFSLIETLPISPREVTLQVSYSGMPSHVPPTGTTETAVAPRLRFLVKPVVKLNDKGEPIWDEPIYLMRIADQAIAPSGGYGADAVDEARRRPDQDAIDRLEARASDFYLTTKKLNNPSDSSQLVAEYLGPGKTEPKLQHYTVRAYEKDAAGKEVSFGKLAELLDAANIPAPGRKGHRVFLARLDQSVPAKRGEWKTVGFNVAIDKTVLDESDTTKTKTVTALTSVVEVLEQPVHYEFKALERRDMRAESGRVIVIHPGAKSTLRDITFDSVRDATRRTATRLEWNANPASLRLTTQDNTFGEAGDPKKPDNRTIGGFDVFSVDPDALPGRSTEEAAQIAEIERAARPMGRVALLPAELDGLDPAGFGDLGRIESAYPSETLRLQNAGKVGAGGLRKAGWYSAAESTVIFPKPAIRRSMMPDPDEGLIAVLFAGGKPKAIRVSIPAWRPQPSNTDISPLKGWEIGTGEQQPTIGWDEYTDTDPAPERTLEAGGWLAVYKSEEGFDVAALRRLLQNLRLQPGKDNAEAALASEQDVLRLRMGQAEFLSNVTVRIEALRYRAKQDQPLVVATQEHSFDPVPALHPVIADAMAFVQYEAQRGGLPDAQGKIYRRYSVAPDDSPKVDSKEFLAYLDEAPPERDPYGWGALRTLGLALGFRLYDTDTGDYVRFKLKGGLGERVRLAFERALARYSDGGKRDYGQPFFDLLTQPWGNVKLAWFDGGKGDVSAEDGERVAEEALAVVQIALRPRPDRLLPAAAVEEAASRPVRYFALVVPKEQPISDQPWGIKQQDDSFDRARYDVLTIARTVVSQKPIRLSQEAPTLSFYEPRPAIAWSDTKRVVAIVRQTTIVGNSPTSPLLETTVPTALVAESFWVEVAQPTVMEALQNANEKLGEEFCFGKFERLPADDWADALFRPTKRGSQVDIHAALNRLAYYAGRRFAPLVYPLVAEEPPPAATAETPQEAEVARLRSEMANRIVTFWSRFLDHCAPAWGKPVGRATPTSEALSIFLSVGTVADPGQWRCAPSQTGTVSVTMVDADRRGARRKFAVRPYGRYEAWSRAALRKMDANGKVYFDRDVPDGLLGALVGSKIADVGRAYFVDTTLPRTEPLEKPVILSSVTHQPIKDQRGRMELVIAHGSDMVLAQANRRNAALLAPLDISVGFWREFAHMPWLTTLEQQFKLTLSPMDQIGSLNGEIDFNKLTITREIAEQRLVNLRQRVPDAWMGSTMVSAMSLPYFFRVHALVHATAGVVVSEQVATTFEEGFFEPAWAHTLKKDEPAGEKRRKLSAKHSFEVGRILNSNTDGTEKEQPEFTTITFDIAALRFIDCVSLEDADVWFGKDGTLWTADFKRVAHLPEPTVSYRIVTETCFTPVGGEEEVLARSPEIEVLPNVPKQATKKPGLYLLQQSGPRYAPKFEFNEPDESGGKAPFTAKLEIAGEEMLSWRIKVQVQLAQEPTTAVLAVGAESVPALEDALAAISKLPQQPEGKFAAAVAGMHTVTIAWTTAPAAGEWVAAVTAVGAREDCPEALGVLATLAANPPTEVGSVKLLVSPEALADMAVTDALAVLNGAVPVSGLLDALLLRRPPRNDELAAFPTTDAQANALRDEVYKLADKQLFGEGRRPAVLASKGGGIPLNDTFLSRKGV